MKIVITLLVLFVSAHSFANSIKLQPKERILSGEDIKTFRLIDINNDGKSDMVWNTTRGDLKYRLQDTAKLPDDASYEEKFHPTETMISGENIRKFELTDINEDGKLDVVYRNANNDLSYQLQSQESASSDNLHTYGFKQTDADIERLLRNSKWMFFHAHETLDFVGKNKPSGGSSNLEFNQRYWGVGKVERIFAERYSFIQLDQGKLTITRNRIKYHVNKITDTMMQGTISDGRTRTHNGDEKPLMLRQWIAFRISE